MIIINENIEVPYDGAKSNYQKYQSKVSLIGYINETGRSKNYVLKMQK